MSDLVTRPNLPDPDGFYADLIKSYEGLEEDEISAFSARLILLLANHIGDPDVIAQALAEATKTNIKDGK